ncbi:hydrolase [Leptolyngbya sp. 15MV]|nr:hydrolase [Leptolyngbya sp. 15MV]
MLDVRLAGTLLLTCFAVPAQAQDSVPPEAATSSAWKFETRVFQLPEGSRPHDAAPGPDGQIWYTAQRQGALGIIDIATGEVRQVPLGEGSAPHGVVLGPDGRAWITDGGQNAIVRYDPATQAIDVWKMPEGTGYTNLNTGAFDADGVHWFTGQNGIYGEVDGATGAVTVYEDPKGRGPYGIDATPDGVVWYSSLAGSHLAQIQRPSGEVALFDPPDAGAGLRRVWSDSKGKLWASGWNTGKLYRYDPASDQWDQWMLPGDGPRTYAVYVDERDLVWVTDFTANATLVFDPASERFIHTIPGSGSSANVRQILGRGDEIYLPESGTDRLMLVTVSR